jgi:pyruvate dehydrogenase complex dehydrogenase (E1) component
MRASRSNRLAASENHGGDLILVQGHSSPGIYARAFLEGRLSEKTHRRSYPEYRTAAAMRRRRH